MAAMRLPRRASPSLARVVLKCLAAILAAVGLVYGLIHFGRRAGDDIASNERYAVKVAELQLDPPPGSDTDTFLTEVRYLARLPETIQSVDPATPAQLKEAFSRHPWVLEVRSVAVRPDGRMEVQLRYRRPALVIQHGREGEIRVLDSQGVLLPSSASTAGLPRYMNITHGPGNAGEAWPDPDARRAAELVTAHEARQIEKKGAYWIITQPNGRVLRVASQ